MNEQHLYEETQSALHAGDADLVRRLDQLQRAHAALQERHSATLKQLEEALRSDEVLLQLNGVLKESEHRFRGMFDALPAAIYTTDAVGLLTYFNPAAVELSGRTPELGTDHWCVSWKLYRADGTPLPHDKCPMAIALKEGRPIRGVEAIAERPDGTRIWFAPFPTPLLDAAGQVVGGINMLVDITERKQAEAAAHRLAAIVESSEDAIVSKTLDGVIRTWNPAAERLFGYTSEEAVNQHISLLIPPERVDEEDLIIARLRAGERVEHFDTVRVRRDGERIHVSLTISPIKDATGAVVGASKIVRDISERKRLEAELRRSEEQRRLALDAAESGAWNVDPTTNELRSDERFRLIFQGSIAPITYEGAFAAVHPDDRARLRDSVAASTRADDPVPYAEEYRVIHPNGEVHWVFAKGRTTFSSSDAAGHRLVSFDGTVVDITARKQAEEERERLLGELREQDRRKNEFLAMLAHELRNPLAPIRSAAHVLRLSGGQNPAVASASEMLERQVGQMVRLVDDLLDVSRVSRGKIELRRGPVDLASVVNHAVEAARPLMQRRDHVLTVTLSSRPIFLHGDSTRLTQVIGNLLSNASKFTDTGGHVWLTVEREQDRAVIRVRDNGIGIAADQLPRIFDMFMQVDTSLERSTSGLGIGLTLVKRLVEMHGGTVAVHSNGSGQGTEFIVRLPILREADHPPVPVMCAPAVTNGRRILVVDDNRDAASMLAQLLQLAGHETHTAHDGLEAVEAAARIRPDVVLLDLGLPKLSGFEAARRIRDQATDYTPVLVALTGWGQDDDAETSTAAGFDRHLIKPVDFDVLEKLLIELRTG